MGPKSKRSRWGDNKAHQINIVNLGRKIRCTDCGDRKLATEYSKRKIFDLKRQRFDGVPFSLQTIRCQLCTPHQNHRLKCSICDETRDLKTGFSYTQRSYADKARCIDCVKMHQETLPLDREEPSEGDDVSDEDDYYVRVSNGTGNYEIPTKNDVPYGPEREEISSALQTLTMEARQVDLREGSPRGSWGGSGYQTMSRREEKMPARNDESSKSDDGWRTVGKQAGKTHRQTESSGYGSQDKKVDTQSPDYSTRSNQADQKDSRQEGETFPHPNPPRRQAQAKGKGIAAPGCLPREVIEVADRGSGGGEFKINPTFTPEQQEIWDRYGPRLEL